MAIDKIITLTINGSRQRVRLCAAREGLPPLLVVQAGPALPLLHEVAKFQRLLNLEQDFLVAYWEQRGCGNVPARDAESATMPQQIADLRSVIQWLHGETGQRVLLFGISIGASISLQAAEHDPDRVRAIIAISADSRTADSDAAVDAFLREQKGDSRIQKRIQALEPPPYVDPDPFQRRARLLADLHTIERKQTFNGLLREFLAAMFRTHGVVGMVRALRNMNIVQRRLLPGIAALDLLANPPRVTVPVHYVFGEEDVLTPESLVKALPAAIAAPGSTVVRLPDAGHMLHFDQPEIVRSIAIAALTRS